MQIHDAIRHGGQVAGEDDGHDLSVAEMIMLLQVIEGNLVGEPCLMDLAADVKALRDALAVRRELAAQVAAEVDAENCVMPH